MSYHRAMIAGRRRRALLACALGCVLASPATTMAQDTPGSGSDTGSGSGTASGSGSGTVSGSGSGSGTDSGSDTDSASASDSASDSASTAALEGPGGELDPNVRSGPTFGSREAIRQSETIAMRGVGQPDATDPELPVALSFFGSVGVVMDSSYDLALQSHAYGPGSPNVLFDGSLTYRVTSWLYLGGRVGARGRGWIRRDGEYAMTTGVDAMAIAHGRVHLGPVIDLGLVLGGGLGVAGVTLHSDTTLGVAPRLHASLQFGFRLARGFHIFVRGAWDYFPWNDLDAGGRDIDLGGPYFGLGLEVKT